LKKIKYERNYSKWFFNPHWNVGIFF
jgi:hypothetical protein